MQYPQACLWPMLLLNSTLYDTYCGILNGSTVNSNEINHMPVPDLPTIH